MKRHIIGDDRPLFGTPVLALRPTVALVAFFPFVFDVAELFLHFLDFLFVSRVFAHVVTELDSRVTICCRDLDDDIERLGLFVI